MKNMDDLINLSIELSGRKPDSQGSDIYSIICGEISTAELEYRKKKLSEFLKDANMADGTYDETRHLISRIDSILISRK